jgi:glycosyltransferase involved in cell wall biosynthesis
MQIFCDISLSRKHIGTPHGIVRVEVSILRELLAIHGDLKPIWIDDSQKITFGKSDDLRILTDGSSSNIPAFSNFSTHTKVFSQHTSHLDELQGIPLKNRMIVLITYFISLFPISISKFLWNFLKKANYILSKSIKPLLEYFSSSSKLRRVQGFSDSLHNFTGDSVILIAGNDWDRNILDQLSIDANCYPKIATVVYDIIPYDYPHFSVDIETSGRFTYWIGDIAQRSDFLFFISRYSQDRFNLMLKERDIVSKAAQMVISLPPGIMPASEMSEPEFRYELENGFILIVCTIEARKNHQILVSALKLAISRGEKFPQLVFVGSPGWGTKQLMHEIDIDEDLKHRVLVKSGVSDNELRWLYEKCVAVAYPSIVEGFGLPVLESTIFKKPVITSDIPVFDEIPHPLRTSVNPYDTEGWKNALQNVGAKTEPFGGWQELELPTWRENVEQMIAFMSK